MPLEGSDELLVNRQAVTYTIEQQNLMAEIQNDDLLLINRSGTTYTATGAELVDSVVDDLSIIVTFNPNAPYLNEVITCVPFISGGVEPEGGYVFTYQWFLASNIAGDDKENLLGENSDTYTPLPPQLGKYLGCRVGTTDARGQIVSEEGVTGPIDYPPVTEPPILNSVVLNQDQINTKRYAGNSFTTSVDVTNRQSSLELEAQVVGALSLDIGSDVITAEDADGDTPLGLTLASDVNLGDGRFEIGDEVTTSTSYTPETSQIIDVDAPGITTTAYTLTGQGQSANLTNFDDNAVLKIMVVEDGLDGGNGGNYGANGYAGGGGKGGDSGNVLISETTVGDYKATYGDSFVFNGTNNFGGTVILNQAIGGGGGAGTGGNHFSQPGGVMSPSSGFTSLNEKYPGVIFTFGTPGPSTDGRNEGGGGGGGAAGLVLTIDSANAPDLNGISNVVPAPTADSGTTAPGPGGFGAAGGTGWGAGGGGGGGHKREGGSPSGIGYGGSGAGGMALLYVEVTAPTTITLTDATDINKFQPGDAVQGYGTIFSTTLYTGNGNSPQFIPTGIDNSNKSLAWFKNRDASQNHRLYDTIRGDKAPLYSNLTNAEGGLSGGLSFESNGIQLDSTDAGLSDSGAKQVVWNFKAAPGFFDVVTWDGDSVYPREIPHSLGVEPGCIILKQTTDNQPWYVYHKDSNANASFYRASLNTTDFFETAGSDIWIPTSTSFSPASFYGGNSINDVYCSDFICNIYSSFPNMSTVYSAFP